MPASAIDGPLGELLELGERILRMTTTRVGADCVAECVIQSGTELSAAVQRGKPEAVKEAETRSASLRLIRGKRVASTSTSDLSAAGVERFISDAIELTSLAQEDPFAGPADPRLLCDPSKTPDLDLYDPAGEAVDATQAFARASEAEAAALAFDPRITQSDGVFSRSSQRSALLLSSGFRATTRGSFHSLGVMPHASDHGAKLGRGSHFTAHRHLGELEPAVAVGREAARRSIGKLGARAVATCRVPVVFAPEPAKRILALLAGCVMGSAIWRKASYLAGREGTRIASDLVTVTDDPFILRAPGSRAFDGEGLASQRNVVVERGVLCTYLCDSYSARKLGRESTASAARGAGAAVGPSTSNFVLQPGTDSGAAILKSTRRGLYVTEMLGYGFNMITGDLSRGASGFWIEDGEIVHAVSGVTISLNIDSLWQTIDAVGSDLDSRTSTAAPTLRVARMTVAGTAS